MPGLVVGTLGREVDIVYVLLWQGILVTATQRTRPLSHETLGEIQCPVWPGILVSGSCGGAEVDTMNVFTSGLCQSPGTAQALSKCVHSVHSPFL